MQPKDWLRDDTKIVLRDQFACQALAALIMKGDNTFHEFATDHEALASVAYQYADAMLKAREKRDYTNSSR